MKFKTGTIETKCSCAERAALCEMVSAFAEEMKDKLLRKLDQGWSGWDEEEFPLDGEAGIKARLVDCMTKNDPIDIANFAAFWWNRLEKPKEEDRPSRIAATVNR